MSEPQQHIVIREAEPAEFATIGALTVETYLALDGMPPRQALPAYYAELEDVEGRAALPGVTILIATSAGPGRTLGPPDASSAPAVSSRLPAERGFKKPLTMREDGENGAKNGAQGGTRRPIVGLSGT